MRARHPSFRSSSIFLWLALQHSGVNRSRVARTGVGFDVNRYGSIARFCIVFRTDATEREPRPDESEKPATARAGVGTTSSYRFV
jgi:hypothetical protein